MLTERKDESKEYSKKEKEKFDQNLLEVLEELAKKISRIKLYSDDRDVKSLISALSKEPPEWSVLVLGELQEENSNLVLSALLEEGQVRLKESKNEIEKLLSAFDPRTLPPLEVSASTGSEQGAAPKVPLSIAQVSDLKDFVGGLLTKDAVKLDDELKNQVLNLYYRLDYMEQILSEGIEKSLKQSSADKINTPPTELSDKADPARIGNNYNVAS